MSLRLASPHEVGIWNRWLWKSHGLRSLPNAVIYFLTAESPMLLTPWRQLDDFALRLDRGEEGPVMTFRLEGSVRTVAQFWSRLDELQSMPPRWSSLKPLETRVKSAAAEGRPWWGIEFPPKSNLTVSFLRFLAPNLQVTATEAARTNNPSLDTSLETSLDLV